MSIKILCMFPDVLNATSYYRGAGALYPLQKKMDVTFHDEIDWSWASVMKYDMVFLQRPFDKMHLTMALIAKSVKVPIIVDYDDNLMDVPTDNPTFNLYNRDEARENIRKILTLADAVTVSTKFLKEIYSEMTSTEKITVVPNAFNFDLFNYASRNVRKRARFVCWRGSNTHVRDTLTVKDQIIKIAKDNVNWKWVFMGDRLWQITDHIPQQNKVFFNAMEVLDYHAQIQALRPVAFIAPLDNNNFNKAKSNIVWFEATYAGAVLLAPGYLEEFKKPGILNYNTQEQFEELLGLILNDSVDVPRYVSESEKYISQNYSLEKVNQKRIKIIKDLS